jgi:hypothetical protein
VAKVITPQNQAAYAYPASVSDQRYVLYGGAIANATSASYALTASVALNASAGNQVSCSWASSSLSASYVATASYFVPTTSSNVLYLQCTNGNTYPVSLVTDDGNVFLNVGDTPVNATNSFIQVNTVSNTQRTSSVLVSNIATNYTLLQYATASIISSKYEYAYTSASNARTGKIMTIWNGSTITFDNTATSDIGDASGLSIYPRLSSSYVQLIASASSTSGWNVNASANYL